MYYLILLDAPMHSLENVPETNENNHKNMKQLKTTSFSKHDTSTQLLLVQRKCDQSGTEQKAYVIRIAVCRTPLEKKFSLWSETLNSERTNIY